jgi:hypothetical protein
MLNSMKITQQVKVSIIGSLLLFILNTQSSGGEITTDTMSALKADVAIKNSTGFMSDCLRTVVAPASFVTVKELSGNDNYYSIESDTYNISMIHANYKPPMKVVKLGYQFPDTCTGVKKIMWDWRIVTPPNGSNEHIKAKNDSGAAVYLIFGDKVRTQIIKYVYSETLPVATVIKRDPLPPLQRMFIIVKSSITDSRSGEWTHVNVDVESDFKRLYASKDCPQLKGIGIMSDGDETNSAVVADYRNFELCRLE